MTRAECAAWLSGHDHFCILTHRRPDGDTLGSAAGLCRILRQAGKTAHVLENPDVTDRLSFLPEGLTKPEAGENDTILCVDVASPGILQKNAEHLLSRCALRIDHHATATSFTPNELVDAGAGACGEIIYDIAEELGQKLTKEAAEDLYVAVSTDTGCFRFANTTAHTFDVAADCTAAGAHIHTWNQKIFDTKSLPKLRLQAWLTDHAQFLADGKLAICALPKAVETSLGVDEDDMNDISSFLRSIEGVRMSALLRETDSEYVKVSIRAVPGYDASAICAMFGGGGHTGAAGCSVKMSMDAAIAAIGKAMLEWEIAE